MTVVVLHRRGTETSEAPSHGTIRSVSVVRSRGPSAVVDVARRRHRHRIIIRYKSQHTRVVSYKQTTTAAACLTVHSQPYVRVHHKHVRRPYTVARHSFCFSNRQRVYHRTASRFQTIDRK